MGVRKGCVILLCVVSVLCNVLFVLWALIGIYAAPALAGLDRHGETVAARSRIERHIMPLVFPETHRFNPGTGLSPDRSIEVFLSGTKSFYVLWNETGRSSDALLFDEVTSATYRFRVDFLMPLDQERWRESETTGTGI